jgi:hypothetical protein
MALQIPIFETQQSYLFNDVYVKVKKIVTSSDDYEFIEYEGDNEIVKWKPAFTTQYVAYVWPDEGARQNQSHPIQHIVGEFVYDFESPENIYSQCYNHINKKYNNTGIKI